MVFNSVGFLLKFLPIFLLIYYMTEVKYRNVILFMGSIYFYAYGEPVYVLLLMASAVLNFQVGKRLDIKKKTAKTKRKILFWTTVAGDAALLVFFKFVPEISPADIKLGMPLGISFYTFQVISYLTDVYRGDIRAEYSFVRLGTYISMFPKLMSGPIVNYSEVSKELKYRKCTLAAADGGLKKFVWGLSLKVLLADRLAILWHEIQTTGFDSISTPLAWMGAFGYSMQIYFDFYGYSLMAVGLGEMLGFSLPENFDLPYMAKSVREFYRRWHMTLGRWFKNYVYIPLGGSRKGISRTVLNLLVVWILTALWHGGSPNFLIWGLSLWLLIVLERLLDKNARIGKSKILSHFYVILVIPLTWMCFAITDVSGLQVYFGRMFGFVEGINVNPADFVKAAGNYGVLFAAGLIMCTPVSKKLFEKYRNKLVGMLVLAALFWWCVWRIMTEGNNPFMYLDF